MFPKNRVSDVGAMLEILKDFPRVHLVKNRTPIHRLNAISRELELDVYVKRDDLTGFAIGGNKVRKLEFLLGEAISKGADTVITIGAVHSNHALVTAVAARTLGMDVVLVLRGREDLRGNYMLERLLGMDVRIQRVRSTKELLSVAYEVARELEASGRKPYVIPQGGASPIGSLGYVLASEEIINQLKSLDVSVDTVVVAAGSGGTLAGLLAGFRLVNTGVKVVGIDVGGFVRSLKEDVERILEGISGMLSVELQMEVETHDYGFGAYGRITPEVVETIKHVALVEGILLDPVYTAKAFYGLMDMARKGVLGRRVLFIHTGGISGLFHYGKEMLEIAGKQEV